MHDIQPFRISNIKFTKIKNVLANLNSLARVYDEHILNYAIGSDLDDDQNMLAPVWDSYKFVLLKFQLTF